MALAVGAFFKFYKTKDFKITSVKWDITTKQLKSRCFAEFASEDDDFVTYTYSSVEGIEGTFSVFYNFEKDKLSRVWFDTRGNQREFRRKFNMENISVDGSRYYAEYNGYHLYLWTIPDSFFDRYATLDSGSWKFEISKEKSHDNSAKVPDEEELEESAAIDEEVRPAISKATVATITDPKTISDPDKFRTSYNNYVNATVEVTELYHKYPDNAELGAAFKSLWDKSSEWGDRGIEMLDIVAPEEFEEYRGWMLDCLQKLKLALNSDN